MKVPETLEAAEVGSTVAAGATSLPLTPKGQVAVKLSALATPALTRRPTRRVKIFLIR
ncbi:MAG: hypothetical protein NC339_06055 [Muribaculaceae bacterium]|nr:hypothetical protein [Muribaculaceae bacterium]